MLEKSYQANRERAFVTDGHTDVCGDISPVQQIKKFHKNACILAVSDSFSHNLFDVDIK